MVAFAAADGHVAEQFRQPVAANDPRRCGPRWTPPQLRARLNQPFDVSSDHGGGSWRVLIVPVTLDGGAAPGTVTRDGALSPRRPRASWSPPHKSGALPVAPRRPDARPS